MIDLVTLHDNYGNFRKVKNLFFNLVRKYQNKHFKKICDRFFHKLLLKNLTVYFFKFKFLK